MRRFALRFGMHWTVPITDGSPWQLSQIITIHTKKRFGARLPKRFDAEDQAIPDGC